MEGSLAIIAGNQAEHPVSIVENRWEVCYARFITYPSLPSSSPSLVPLPHNNRSRPTRGNWISSRSSSASLQVLDYHYGSQATLSVCLGENILEQHYVSKLHISWPQVLCVPEYPPRGIRAVFVSYKDSVGEIQKFALRFSTACEAGMFINALKDTFKDGTAFEPLASDLRSEISSQSVFLSTNRHPSRVAEESSNISPVQTYTPQLPLNVEMSNGFEQDSGTREVTVLQNFNSEVEQDSGTKETSHNCDGISRALPPSFASLLSNCCSEVQQAAALPSLCGELDLKSQIARYMEDSSFQDMLLKVEKVINEIGDDLLL